MAIHAMILNWPRQTKNAEVLYAAVAPYVARCDVVNSDIEADRPGWINIGDGWGTAQWIAMRQNLSEDTLLSLYADVRVTNAADIIADAIRNMQIYPIGVYAPNIEGTYWRFDERTLPHIAGRLCHVPQTDGMMLFTRRRLVEAIPTLDASINKIGYGIDPTIIALAYQRRLWVCRDYAHTVFHPPGSAYSHREAGRQSDAMLSTYPEPIRTDTRSVIRDVWEAMNRSLGRITPALDIRQERRMLLKKKGLVR